MEFTEQQLNKLRSIVASYKKHIINEGGANEDELYKFKLINEFQDKWDLQASNLELMIKGIKFHNLIYHASRSTLLHVARDRSEELRQLFKNLFNDSLDLQQRVEHFQKNIRKTYNEINEPKWHNKDRQEERAIATYLTFYNPNKYTLYKASFARKLWKLLGIKQAKSGQRYSQYMQFINAFITNILLKDNELLELENNYLTEDSFNDPNRLILAQDILYQMLDKKTFIQEAKYWRIGTTDGHQSHWEKMKQGSFVSIGWPELGDISKLTFSNKTEFMEIFTKKCPYMAKKSPQVSSRKGGEILNFFHQINIGDYIIASQGQTVLGIGKIIADYHFDSNYEFPHQRKVKWLTTKVQDLIIKSGPQTTVYNITDETEMGLIQNYLAHPKRPITGATITPKISALNSILYGPPGTGKTYEVCKLLGETNNVRFVTFHQNYNYEEFLEGIKPIMHSKTEGQLSYRIEEGIFYKACQEALESVLDLGDEESEEDIFDYYDNLSEEEKINLFDDAPQYYFIIDEINRGNISSIFGELITLIEVNKRIGAPEEILLTLPYSQKKFGVPKNLYIIGTMNTADKSVEALDTALRRRFSFKEMPPQPSIISQQENKGKLIVEGTDVYLANILETINKRIEVLLDQDHLIGHSYFLNINTTEQLQVTFEKNIIPLLQEYFYGDYGKIALVLGEGFCVEEKIADFDNLFATVSDYDTSMYQERRNYRLKTIKNDTDLLEAIQSLLNEKKEQATTKAK